ncbi:MAG: GTP 3',8-cyclase MoaA, partial [bacterium]
MRESTNSCNEPPQLVDNFGRRISYVRLSVIDRCNLRCLYCMPENGIRFLPRREILSYEEITRFLFLLADMGICKVRITGGEPFVRKDIMLLLRRLRQIEGIRNIHITTNGVLAAPYIPELKDLGIAGINLSLDTLERERFYKITRRDHFDDVMKCFHKILKFDIPLKINMVVMDSCSVTDVISISQLARDYAVDVRFIEEMPFNGRADGKWSSRWDYNRVLRVLRKAYPDIFEIDNDVPSTSKNYAIPGFKGLVGIIAGFSRTFCATCSRIRITARGMLQTCLYGEAVLNIKDLLRTGADDETIKAAVRGCINSRFEDGWQAVKHRR